jgi:hypothetical protein
MSRTRWREKHPIPRVKLRGWDSNPQPFG